MTQEDAFFHLWKQWISYVLMLPILFDPCFCVDCQMPVAAFENLQFVKQHVCKFLFKSLIHSTKNKKVEIWRKDLSLSLLEFLRTAYQP